MGNELSQISTENPELNDSARMMFNMFTSFNSFNKTGSRPQKHTPPENLVSAIKIAADSIVWTDEYPIFSNDSMWSLAEQGAKINYYSHSITPVVCKISTDISRTYRYGLAMVILMDVEEALMSKAYFVLIKPQMSGDKIVSDIIYQNKADISQQKVYEDVTNSNTTNSNTTNSNTTNSNTTNSNIPSSNAVPSENYTPNQTNKPGVGAVPSNNPGVEGLNEAINMIQKEFFGNSGSKINLAALDLNKLFAFKQSLESDLKNKKSNQTSQTSQTQPPTTNTTDSEEARV